MPARTRAALFLAGALLAVAPVGARPALAAEDNPGSSHRAARVLPLGRVVARTKVRLGGRLLDAELVPGDGRRPPRYRLRWLRGRQVMLVVVNARSAAIIAIR